MLGVLLKRRRKKKKKTTIRGMDGEQMELADAPKGKKSKKSEDGGTSWGVMALLVVTVLVGLVFWLYGEVAGTSYHEENGVERMQEDEVVKESENTGSLDWMEDKGEKVDLNKEGVIIFEK